MTDPKPIGMVERVARAICFQETGIDGGDLFRLGGFGEPKEPYPLWKTYEKNARAAIEAMREINEDMEWALFNNLTDDGNGIPAAWSKAIDAALAEDK